MRRVLSAVRCGGLRLCNALRTGGADAPKPRRRKREFAENYSYLTDFNGIYSDYYMTADGLAERSYGDNVIVITEGDTFAVLEPA